MTSIKFSHKLSVGFDFPGEKKNVCTVSFSISACRVIALVSHFY